MIKTLLSLLLILSIILGGIWTYANAAYFPLQRGLQVEQDIKYLNNTINSKLETLLERSE